MHGPTQPSIWSKIDYSLVVEPAAGEGVGRNESLEQWRRGWRPRRIFLDILATLLWLYAVLELFVFNVNDAVLGGSSHLRFFYFAALAVGLVILFRGAWYLVIIPFAYIFFFPLVVLCWKFPRALYKTGSSIAFLATANALTSIVGDLKHTVVTTTMAAFAILLSPSHTVRASFAPPPS